MHRPFFLRSALALAVPVALFAACGGSSGVDDGLADQQGGGGTGAKAGSGGASAGSAGSSAKAGASGASGASGKAGSAGSAGTAGSAGASGTAGNAGKGGASGASGSAGGGGAAMCTATTADCNGDPKDGCETTITTDPKNCSGCGKACPSAPNSVPTCKGGTCFTDCAKGFNDCNNDPKDGCEKPTSADVANCGACGKTCPAGAHGTPKCVDSGCGFTCENGFGDCNGLPADGCEANLATDAKNCGLCGKQCDMGGTCVNGGCKCAGTSVQAQLIPLDMYVMFDRSGSMQDAGKWTNATSALKKFVQNPGSAGIGVGLQFFPNTSSCSTASYKTPKVGIATLPGAGNAQATALVNAINGEGPNGSNTPTGAALGGAIEYVQAFKAANPTHKVIVVLATDGEPNGCGTLSEVVTIAKNGFAANPPVSTYVIGVGSSLSNLNQVAAAGGTSAAIIVNSGDEAQFLQAMKDIQGKSIGCEYLLPPPPTGGMLDYTKVNVKFTPTGGQPATLPGVANAAACTAAGGWYYDVPPPGKPTKIELCPGTCGTVQKDQNAKVDIELGCDTQKQ